MKYVIIATITLVILSSFKHVEAGLMEFRCGETNTDVLVNRVLPPDSEFSMLINNTPQLTRKGAISGCVSY